MPAPVEKKMKNCPNCGESVPLRTKQCPNCGQLLGGSSRMQRHWMRTLTPTEIFLLVLGSLMLGVFLVAL